MYFSRFGDPHNVVALPTITRQYLARVSETLRRVSCEKKSTALRALERTMETTTKSVSLPLERVDRVNLN